MELRQDGQITEEQVKLEEGGLAETRDVFTPQSIGWDEQNGGAYTAVKNRLTKKEFYHHAVMKQCRSNINACSIILYICSFLTFVVNIFLYHNILGVLDVILLVGLGLGIQLGQSRVCAIVALVYSLINTLYALISTGHLSGYLIVICGAYATMSTFKYQKAWKEYEMTGSYPGIG